MTSLSLLRNAELIQPRRPGPPSHKRQCFPLKPAVSPGTMIVKGQLF